MSAAARMVEKPEMTRPVTVSAVVRIVKTPEMTRGTRPFLRKRPLREPSQATTAGTTNGSPWFNTHTFYDDLDL